MIIQKQYKIVSMEDAGRGAVAHDISANLKEGWGFYGSVRASDGIVLIYVRHPGPKPLVKVNI